MNYTCRIDGQVMHCEITSSKDLKSPLFCFSAMGPIRAISGGQNLKSVGSYTEVALPDLSANISHVVTLQYEGGFTPANRAWMPLGPYLKTGRDLHPLPPTPSGVNKNHLGNPPAFEGLRLVPPPNSFEPTGEKVAIRTVNTEDDGFKNIHRLAERRGMGPFLSTEGIDVTVKSDASPEDAYTLDIAQNGVTVTANSYGGRLYAGITLLSLIQTHNGEIPCGTISDSPRFSWRGQHLDTARHYYRPETIYDLLDLMALLKLNRFHWHFADDEAFRLQIESLPELWKKTEMRGEGHLLPNLFTGATEGGGSYTKDEAKAIITHAAELNIEVLPEIEAPAHALAIANVFPEVRDPADNGAETSVQGYKGNAMNPAMPKTWEILNAIVTEVGALFPFNHLHLGCDELPKDTWMGSPKARDLMKEHGLETTQDLQGWTMEHLAKTVVANGQRPAAWEEAAQGSNGGIGSNAILFTWTGQGPGLEAARAGYDVVMTPAQHAYLDMAWSDDVDDWGASWAAFVSLADTLNWDPVPDPSLTDRIIGVQGAFWSEFTTEDSQMWPMLLPRILGIATKAWQSTDTSVDDLTRLAGHFLATPLRGQSANFEVNEAN